MRLRALPIINTRLALLTCLRAYAVSPSWISALRTFVLSCYKYRCVCRFLFNSLFTVDFSIVITTNLHWLTENFIIKKKIKNILKVASRGASESRQSWRWRFFRKQPTATSSELYSQKAPPQMPNQQSDCTLSHNLTLLLTTAMRDCLLLLR